MSFLDSHLITQHSQTSRTGELSRSPFVPVRKHGKGSLSPPVSPRPTSHPSTPGNSHVLTPTAVHNLPSIALQTSSPTAGSHTSNTPSRKLFSAEDSMSSPGLQLGMSPSAPRVRAKLTPAATPRRKGLLPGTENADIPTPRGSPGLMTRAPPTSPQLVSARSMSPAVSPARDFGAFPSSAPVASSLLGSYGQAPIMVRGEDAGVLRGTGTSSATAHSSSSRGKDNVMVCVRVRPPAAKLASAQATVIEERAWDVHERAGRLQQCGGVGTDFVFDSIVTGSDNEAVYQEAGKDLVVAAMEGFDSVIFAYGQTASGKTFTLTGNTANPGIIPQAVAEIFTYIREHPEREFLLRASYLEIYNETLKDLLAPETGPLRIRQDERKRFFVHPLREEVVTGEAQVAALLKRGEANRSIGATDYNETSSRSHSLFQMTIESRDEGSCSPEQLDTPMRTKSPNGPRLGGTSVRMSRLSLIDLAGSEQATSQQERRNEGAFINKSLLTLEKVIASLTEDSKRKPHVPYRDSKLTQILQPSLSGDARVAVIATMNPSPAAVEETKSTLKFAQRIKKVVLKATVNEVVDDKALIFKYRAEIARLQAQLTAQQMLAPTAPSLPAVNEDTKKLSIKSSTRVQGLESQIAELRSLFITSENVEDRRRSVLPPRPVSPMKMGAGGGIVAISEDPTDGEKLIEAQDEVAYLKEENADLKARISELEEEQLRYLKSGAAASESDKDRRIAQLVQENQELLVVLKNADAQDDLRKQDVKLKREQDKRIELEQRLTKAVEFERNRIKKMEHYIITKLQTQVDVLAGRRGSYGMMGDSTLNSGGAGVPRPSYGGLLPIMGESSPEIAQGIEQDEDNQEFGDLLFFSEEARHKIQKSASILFA